MVETYQRRTALAHLGLVGRAATAGKATSGVTMSEVGHRTIINIRGDRRRSADVGQLGHDER